MFPCSTWRPGHRRIRWDTWRDTCRSTRGRDPLSRSAARSSERSRRYFARDWYEKVFCVAAARGIACELRCPKRSPSPDMVRLGLDMGVKFSVGSDAHLASWIGDVSWAYDLLESLGARQTDIWSPRSRG